MNTLGTLAIVGVVAYFVAKLAQKGPVLPPKIIGATPPPLPGNAVQGTTSVVDYNPGAGVFGDGSIKGLPAYSGPVGRNPNNLPGR